jgi:hypothetical protein
MQMRCLLEKSVQQAQSGLFTRHDEPVSTGHAQI